eukprot:Colp12_sorted_trinity150504_noHs@2395
MINYTKAMLRLDLSQAKTRKEIEQWLVPDVPNETVRQFLMTNLVKGADHQPYRWRINLKAIDQHMANMTEFNYEEKQFTHPTLFIAGAKANYVRPSHTSTIHKYFPTAKIEYLDCGHWVHAEKPREFLHTVRHFFAEH